MLRFPLLWREWAEKSLINLAGLSSASPEPVNETASPEKVTDQMEIHLNQSAADNADAERALVEAENDTDSDGSGSIIYTPKGSDEEYGGQKIWGSDQHGPIM